MLGKICTKASPLPITVEHNTNLLLPTSETLGRMGKRFGSRDIWDRLGGQALTTIGRWYSRQPYKQNFYSHRLNLNTVSLQISKETLLVTAIRGREK